MPTGGPRPNAGRKPTVNPVGHRTKAEKEPREQARVALQTSRTLKCPNYLTDLAKKEWRRTMRLYNQMDASILCDLDVAALVMYCEAWAIYRTAQDQWAKLQVVASTNPSAQALIDKTIDTMNKQTAVISKLAEQLCLTPVGRARMGMNPTQRKAGDKLLELLNDDGDDEDDG